MLRDTFWEGAIERPPPCEMVQVASVFDHFCDLRLALSCAVARCSFQALCDSPSHPQFRLSYVLLACSDFDRTVWGSPFPLPAP